MPELCGSTTVSASKVAIAASVALPPRAGSRRRPRRARIGGADHAGSSRRGEPWRRGAAAQLLRRARPPRTGAGTGTHRAAATRFPPPRQYWRSRRSSSRLARPRGDPSARARGRDRPSPCIAGPGWRPARIRSHASSAVAIPPTPISGSSPPDAARKSRNASSASGSQRRARQAALFSPHGAIVAAAARRSCWRRSAHRCHGRWRRGRSGRDRPRRGRARPSGRSAVRPSARASCTAASSASSAPSSCSSRRPGVLGELMLTVR